MQQLPAPQLAYATNQELMGRYALSESLTTDKLRVVCDLVELMSHFGPQMFDDFRAGSKTKHYIWWLFPNKRAGDHERLHWPKEKLNRNGQAWEPTYLKEDMFMELWYRLPMVWWMTMQQICRQLHEEGKSLK